MTDYHFFRLSLTLGSTFSLIWKWLKNFTLPQNNNLKKLSFIIVHLKRKENCFDSFFWLRTTLLVLPLGWRRQMQGKLKAFISNTMNTTLELLTRGNRQTGIQMIVTLLLFSSLFFSCLFVSFLVVSDCIFDHLNFQSTIICLLNPNSWQSATWKSLPDCWSAFWSALCSQ